MNGDETASEGTRGQPAVFTTTHWSVVLAAGKGDTPQAMAALEKLCQTYWYPLYAYVRRKGYAAPDAEDLIQGFLAALLRRQAFRGVVPGRAKFRTFLQTALQHFLTDEHDRQQAQKRGGGQPVLSLDTQAGEERYRLEPQDLETPEKLFERRWAMTLLANALTRLEQESAATGKGAWFQQLRGLVTGGGESGSSAEVARQLGTTPEAVRKAVERLRRRFRELVRDEISHTVTTPGEVEEELRHLRSLLFS